MLELSMHILDIVQNSLVAGSTRVEIRVREDLTRDLLRIEVNDNGQGMSREVLSRVTDPFFTSRKTRDVGLGVSLFKEAAERCGGHLEVHSQEGQGTKMVAFFQLDHFDRAPLGDMGETLAILISANPDVDFLYINRVDGQTYRLETQEMREILNPVGLEDPSVLQFIRQDVQMGLKKSELQPSPKLWRY